MGQLAVDLQEPQNRIRIRAEGGQYEYEDPVHLFADLVATRRAWQNATILASSETYDQTVNFVAFWEVDDPTIDFFLSIPAAVRIQPDIQFSELFGTREGEVEFLFLVELEAKRLGGFDARLNPEDRPSSWVRLFDDEDKFS